MIYVDLNCDMGESSKGHTVGDDEGVMPYISSANIACGLHGGDPDVMAATILLAKQSGVAIGAHPSFNDKLNFGRKEMELDASEIFKLVYEQVATLRTAADSLDARVTHLKPHGALYNMAAKRLDYAEAIIQALKAIDPSLVLFGLSGSLIISVAAAAGIRTCAEVFADRSYQENGSLTPRNMPGAMITDVHEAVEQAVEMVLHGRVRTLQGNWITMKADTICIHGDTPGAAAYAEKIREGLQQAGVGIRSYNQSR